MKRFDFAIGNPPYQEEPEMGSSRSLPVYDAFMDAAFSVCDKSLLITPARFLFNAGQTKKEWNKKMLSDEHFKVLSYEADSSKLFPSVNIMGGVAITYRDRNETFGEIGTFIAVPTLRAIAEKAKAKSEENSIASIAESQNNYDFSELYKDYPEYDQYISGEGHHSQLKSNALSKVPIFTEEKKSTDDFKIYGLIDGKRTFRFCCNRYIRHTHKSLMKYKVLIPNSNGSGAIGENGATVLIGNPMIIEPYSGYTQTFMSIGFFDTEKEAKNLIEYVKTKFCRTLLGILKVTQANPPITWKYVPLQDFTDNSDIDWSKSIKEIDQQLYKKYDLSDEEINFIETHVKEMK